MTPKECRAEYGESHDAHMAINGECPWCGASDPDQAEFMSIEEATEAFGL